MVGIVEVSLGPRLRLSGVFLGLGEQGIEGGLIGAKLGRLFTDTQNPDGDDSFVWLDLVEQFAPLHHPAKDAVQVVQAVRVTQRDEEL